MKVDVKALKAKMIVKGKTTKELIESTGISRSAYYRKLKGETEFSRKDIIKISQFLQLPKEEWMDIFFNEKVS